MQKKLFLVLKEYDIAALVFSEKIFFKVLQMRIESNR